MKCPKCGSNTGTVSVDVGLKIPARFVNLIDKTMIRRKDVILRFANWPKALFVCDKCTYREKGL